MQKIIKDEIGKRRKYDTDTAALVADWDNGLGRSDFGWTHEQLYQKRTGEFFIYGESGPAGKYSERCGNNSWCGGEGITPITRKQAEDWVERNCNEEYEKIFGAVAEGDSVTTISANISVAAYSKLQTAALDKGVSMSALLNEILLAL